MRLAGFFRHVGQIVPMRGQHQEGAADLLHSGRFRPPAHVLGPRPVVEEDPLQLEDGNFATVLTISDRMCRWPIGDPAATEFHFCGRGPKAGSPYCEAHARKAYQPQQARRDKDNKGRLTG